MKTLDLQFTSLTLRDNYVIGCTREGVTVDLKKHRYATATVMNHINGSYGIILDEKNSYDIEFDVMMDVAKDKNIIAGAVVMHRAITRQIFNIFTPYLNKPLRFFTSMEEAEQWMNKIVFEHRQKRKN